MAERRNRRDFTREEVCAVLSYDSQSGIFRWLVETHGFGGKIRPGDEAGTIKDGYRMIILYGRQYRAHHLAWLIMTGEWPNTDIDIEHRDRDRSNNAWGNLRIATRSQNNMNTGLRSNNKSGHKGVGQRSDNGRWYARVTVDRRVILLGHFATRSEAVDARREAERRHFGEFSSV